MDLNEFSQAMIALFGVTAIFLSQSAHIEWRRWASVLGLVGQPFWFISSYMTESWGIFILCFFYTFAWGKGFVSHWVTRSAYKEVGGASTLAAETKLKLHARFGKHGTIKQRVGLSAAKAAYPMLSEGQIRDMWPGQIIDDEEREHGT